MYWKFPYNDNEMNKKYHSIIRVVKFNTSTSLRGSIKFNMKNNIKNNINIHRFFYSTDFLRQIFKNDIFLRTNKCKAHTLLKNAPNIILSENFRWKQ